VSTVVGQYGVDFIGNSLHQRRRKFPAMRRVAFSTSCVKANLEVRLSNRSCGVKLEFL
jgi:hypothetical protein